MPGSPWDRALGTRRPSLHIVSKREARIVLIRHRLVGDKALGYRLLSRGRMPGGLPAWAGVRRVGLDLMTRAAGGGDRSVRPHGAFCRRCNNASYVPPRPVGSGPGLSREDCPCQRASGPERKLRGVSALWMSRELPRTGRRGGRRHVFESCVPEIAGPGTIDSGTSSLKGAGSVNLVLGALIFFCGSVGAPG